MASTFGKRLWERPVRRVPAARSLGRRMSWHAAAALLSFAILQIWLVSSAIGNGAPAALTIIALALLIGLALPIARKVERRWYHLSREALASWGLHARFRRDVARLWLGALTLPALWIGFAIAVNWAIGGASA